MPENIDEEGQTTEFSEAPEEVLDIPHLQTRIASQRETIRGQLARWLLLLLSGVLLASFVSMWLKIGQ